MTKPRKKTSPSKRLKVKDSKIANIKDETNELHPLLEKLFAKLPSITDVEYRQGTNEKGADFVLRKTDELLGNQEYIGVVAKIGTIHQSLAKIEEQIEESFLLERFVRNGKEKIYLQEVWVVFTEGTTPNAEEKIHEKFRSHKIKFIDGRHLGKLVDTYIPYYWDQVSLETGKYLSEVSKHIAETEKSVSLVNAPTGDIYIEPDISTFPTNKYKRKVQNIRQKSSKVNIFNEIRNQRLLFIEGDMGVGKSKLIRKLAEHYAAPQTFNDTGIIPVPVSFRELINDFEGDVEKLIDTRISAALKDELAGQGTYLILIDGMDEKLLSIEDQLQYLEMLVSNVRNCGNVKMVLTSRPLKIFDDAIQLNANISTYLLHPLSFSKSIQLIKEICVKLNMADRIIEDLRKSQLFQELPKNPIAVILLANLLNENREEIPSNLTELYAKYVEFALGRWDVSKGFKQQKEYEALQQVLMTLSVYIVDNDLKYISVRETREFFANYLDKRKHLELSVDGLFDLLMDRTELMTYSSDKKSIAFKHKTFAEFLYAKQARENGNLVIDNRAFQLYWINTFFFFLGLTKDAQPILEELLKVTPKDDIESVLRVINMGNFLLAAYLTPYETVEKVLAKIAVEAAELYQRIIERETELYFARLPRMHFLWLFQMLLRGAYGYGYFREAIETAALEIATTETDSNTKAYALFFLNVIYMDITVDKSFHFLLENVETLPMDISLAYIAETDGVKKRTDIMKRTDRKIRRSLRGNRREIAAIEQLYTDPIKSFDNLAKGLPPGK